MLTAIERVGRTMLSRYQREVQIRHLLRAQQELSRAKQHGNLSRNVQVMITTAQAVIVDTIKEVERTEEFYEAR